MLSEAPPICLMHQRKSYETLQQQWLSLLVVQHPICRAERVPQIWHFVYHLSIDLGGK